MRDGRDAEVDGLPAGVPVDLLGIRQRPPASPRVARPRAVRRAEVVPADSWLTPSVLIRSLPISYRLQAISGSLARQEAICCWIQPSTAAGGRRGDTLCELVAGSGKADFESFDFAEPAFALGLHNAGNEVVADGGDAGPLGWVGPEHGAAMQACSWVRGVANARPHRPADTLRRSECPRNCCHSSDVAVRHCRWGAARAAGPGMAGGCG